MHIYLIYQPTFHRLCPCASIVSHDWTMSARMFQRSDHQNQGLELGAGVARIRGNESRA